MKRYYKVKLIKAREITCRAVKACKRINALFVNKNLKQHIREIIFTNTYLNYQGGSGI